MEVPLPLGTRGTEMRHKLLLYLFYSYLAYFGSSPESSESLPVKPEDEIDM